MLELAPVPVCNSLPSFGNSPAFAWSLVESAASLPSADADTDADAPLAAPSAPRPEDETLSAWMALIRDRDEAGLRLLYRSCRRQVFLCALGIVRQEHVANEVVSTTFMQLWMSAPRYDPRRGSVSAWLMLMARSRALDALRSVNAHRHQESPLDDDSEAEPDADELGPLAHSDRQCRYANLRRALLRLSPIQRQVLTLTTLGGLSQDEAAGYLHMPLGTVKSHAKRALAAMRHHCEALGLSAH
jgi:RNA polymerase sigma-70 factor (ECF subfamily)